MSGISNVVIFDGAATPVSHTFVPVSVTRSGAVIAALWREQLAGVPLEGQVTLQTELRQLKSGTWQTTAMVTVPVMESISGQNAAGYTAAPKIAFTDTYKLTGYHSRRSTVGGRRLARQLMLNWGNSEGSSFAPRTNGFLPELYDQLISAT